MHYYEVLTADQRSIFLSALAVSRPEIYTFKNPVGHTHLWTCACALVHFRAIDSAIAAILLRMRIQRKPSGLVYSSARMYASKRVVSTSSCVDLKERVLTFCFPRVFRGYTEVETDKKVSIPGPL